MTDGESARGFVIEGRAFSAGKAPAGLSLVATPIGNLEDMSLRALKTLAGADAVLCEDTRRTGRLLQRFSIRNRLLAYHDHNAGRMRPRILKMLGEGRALALVSDAGTPVVSDPGMKLAREAARAGFAVTAVPGPSAPLTALALSGLPSDRFFFAGFAPSASAARRAWLEELAGVRATVILFESPRRVAAALADMAAIFGPREAALCREMTKLHEEVLRMPLDRLAEEMAGRGAVKGEITLVIAPPESSGADAAEVEAALREALRDNPAGKAAAMIARRFGLSRAEAYALALKLRT